MARILLIEDEDNIRKIIAYDLKKADFDIVECGDGRTAVDLAMKEDFDVLIIDWMLPHVSGIDIVKKLRSEHIDAIFIMLTARDDETDILYAFEQGVDDYITKPYQPPLLLARIAAVLKRTGRLSPKEAPVLLHRGVELDIAGCSLRYGSSNVELTKSEMKILYQLFQRPGQYVFRMDLIEYLWENQIFIDDNTLSVHMARIREKLKETGIKDFIETKRGIGYRI